MDDLYSYLLKDEQLKGMFENWGYDDKVIISRCNDLLIRIKSYLQIFGYENIKEGVNKDATFHAACLNNILQIRKLICLLPMSHVEALQKLGIIVIAPRGIGSNPFIPFNDMVLKNMEKVFSDILGLQSSINDNVLVKAKNKIIVRGIDFKISDKLVKAKKELMEKLETGNVNLIKDVLSLIGYVEKLDYHLQRCEVDDYITFITDRACMDAISYTLIESLKCMQKASEDTKQYYVDLAINLPRLSKVHLAIVKRGITAFENINENYYMEELWSQIKIVTDSTFSLIEIALKEDK